MSRASGIALAAVLVGLSAGGLAAASQDPVREADPPCRKAAASQDPDGEELVGLFSTKTKELLDASGAARAKPAVVVIFMNLDGGKKNTQYVLKRARKVGRPTLTSSHSLFPYPYPCPYPYPYPYP
jgi:hypothetical protein